MLKIISVTLQVFISSNSKYSNGKRKKNNNNAVTPTTKEKIARFGFRIRMQARSPRDIYTPPSTKRTRFVYIPKERDLLAIFPKVFGILQTLLPRKKLLFPRSSNSLRICSTSMTFNSRVLQAQEVKNILLELIERNNKRISNHDPLELLWMDKNIQLLFVICDELDLTEDAKYLACAIMERFLARDCINRYNESKTCDRRTVEELVPVVVFTCAQIAAKFVERDRRLDQYEIVQHLKCFGYEYTAKSVYETEVRILKTLNFDVDVPSPVVYVKWIIYMLSFDEPSLDIDCLVYAAAKILSCVYAARATVYDCLYKCLTGNGNILPIHVSQFNQVKFNFVFLACGVITASCARFHVSDIPVENVIAHLHTLFSIKTAHIAAFAYAILGIVPEPEF